MAHTYNANEFNSTPLSSCCNVASMGSRCDKCGESIEFHQHSPAVMAARRLHSQGRCGICGGKRGNPAISGNCHC